jgi:hypothetical protein
MLGLKILLWIVAVALMLIYPLAKFADNMMTIPRSGPNFWPFAISVAGVVLALLLATGRIL